MSGLSAKRRARTSETGEALAPSGTRGPARSASAAHARSEPAENLPAALARPFKIIAFDWDGTAVTSRNEDAGPIRAPIEALLRLGVPVLVITGTNFPNVDRQLSTAIHGPPKRNLYISANRGSEVYGFDDKAASVRVWARQATPEEDRLLTEIAVTARETLVARTGLAIDVIYDRLNRRKIDLIPLPEWRDPPKSELERLEHAVENRLRRAGLAGGLAEAFTLVERIARAEGLPRAPITSDVKHIEVGLTDKSDAIDWMMRELAQPRGISADEILVAGDEFGPIAGFPGSDDKMIVPAVRGATFVSVGPEPGGAPSEVIHLGGGPARFRALLAVQVALHEESSRTRTMEAGAVDTARDLPLAVTADGSWLLVDEGFNLSREHEVESQLAVANGYVGTRGSLAEGSSLSSAATYVAGIFDTAPRPGAVPELVVLPDWTRLRIVVHGHELALERGEILEHRRVLDLRQGIHVRQWRHRDPAGRITRLSFLRLASIADRHLVLQSLALTPENYGGRVHVEAPIESGTLIPRQAATAPTAAGSVALLFGTPSRDTSVGIGVAGRMRDGLGREIERAVEIGAGRVVESWDWDAEIARTYRLDRLVSIHTSRDADRPAHAASAHLDALSVGADKAIEAHARAWASRAEAADVAVEGDEQAARALRFAVYHLIGAANPEDERVSIGARALTGAAYKGHVFWDTEIYMLPFFTFTDPASARALLLYRSHTLPAARAKARSLGYRGALYAWESTDSGEETTPSTALAPDGELLRILTGEQEHHISADVAYAVWQYWQASGDDEYFRDAGAEILLETARFWASRGQLEADGRFHIRAVIGPDEYHETVDDNAFTNGLAQWNLERGVETLGLLERRWPERWRELTNRLELGAEEPARWRQLAEAMETGFDARTGLFEQFRGYFDLEEIDLATYEPRTVPIDLILGRERTRRSNVVKQADVVLLIYLLWDRFPAAVREANFRYYAPRTAHGSSLSPAIHALVAARLGEVALAERYFRQAAEIDLADNMGNAAGGVHAAALGGLWQAAVFGFGGFRAHEDGLAFDPHPPRAWHHLRFPVAWRKRRVRVDVRGEPLSVQLRLEGRDSLHVALADGTPVPIRPGHGYSSERRRDGWGPWQETSG